MQLSFLSLLQLRMYLTWWDSWLTFKTFVNVKKRSQVHIICIFGKRMNRFMRKFHLSLKTWWYSSVTIFLAGVLDLVYSFLKIMRSVYYEGDQEMVQQTEERVFVNNLIRDWHSISMISLGIWKLRLELMACAATLVVPFGICFTLNEIGEGFSKTLVKCDPVSSFVMVYRYKVLKCQYSYY
jgi:hypothetical protein